VSFAAITLFVASQRVFVVVVVCFVIDSVRKLSDNTPIHPHRDHLRPRPLALIYFEMNTSHAGSTLQETKSRMYVGFIAL
jgi:hypothetical protein